MNKLLKLAVELEDKGFHEYSAKIPQLIREINAASSKESEVEISSWPDFLGWWNSNRGQSLSYIFIDTYGEDSEEAKEVQKLIDEANALEQHLHAFYMSLRNKAQAAQAAQNQAVPAPAAPAPAPEPSIEDADSLEG
jgi:hypothetical protein